MPIYYTPLWYKAMLISPLAIVKEKFGKVLSSTLFPLVDKSPPNFLILTMRFLITLFVLFFSTLSFAGTAQESPLQIWNVKDRRWTVEEEVRFGKWVEKNITEDFFIRYKIPVDCADVPYAVRWIYARIAHLPASFQSR